jgi:hypothetical protein
MLSACLMTVNGGDLIILNMAFWAVYCARLRLRPALHTDELPVTTSLLGERLML